MIHMSEDGRGIDGTRQWPPLSADGRSDLTKRDRIGKDMA